MIKPDRLEKGDKVAIVSLSSGILGEESCSHQIRLGIQRLKDFSLVPEFMPHALKGLEFVRDHPERRAEDLKNAFENPDYKIILCAIGGDDTFRLTPFLNTPEFRNIVQKNPKIFTGFSDTTQNHLLLYKFGLMTYYGPSFLTDFAELDKEMLPFTREWILEFFTPAESREVLLSETWYDDREDFLERELSKPRKSHKETHGLETIFGSGKIYGELLGGCVESLSDDLTGLRYSKQPDLMQSVFPSVDEWRDKILFIETSEEKPTPEKLRTMLKPLADFGIFDVVRGVLVGKPQNEQFYDEYKSVWREIGGKFNLPILYNLNFGHSFPRMILPYGAKVELDMDNKSVRLLESIVN